MREVVVITGASAGAGRATVIEFARQGASAVVLLARGRDGLDGARRDVEASGAQAAGFSAQQTDEPVASDHPDNLFEPVPGDRGVEGPFRDRVAAEDRLFALTEKRDTLTTAAGALLAAVGLSGLRRRGRPD